MPVCPTPPQRITSATYGDCSPRSRPEGFDHLREGTAAAVASQDDPADRLIAMGEAYVSLATEHPAHCQVMFRTDVVDPDDPGLREAGLGAFGVLHDTVSGLIAAEGLDVDVDVASELCWATMQGLVVLQPKLALLDTLSGIEPVPVGERVRRLTALMLDGIRHSVAHP